MFLNADYLVKYFTLSQSTDILNRRDKEDGHFGNYWKNIQMYM